MCSEPRSLAVELAPLARSTPVVGYQWIPRCSGVDPQLGGTAVLGETLWADRRKIGHRLLHTFPAVSPPPPVRQVGERLGALASRSVVIHRLRSPLWSDHV